MRALLRKVERHETFALVLLALVPFLPYLVLILWPGVGRFALCADLALQEYNVRHVWRGDVLLGLGSRWLWSHPGPALFYFIAPFQKLFGSSSTGLYVGTWFLSASSVAAVVAAARTWGGRAHGVAAVFVSLAWFSAFGNVAANPWVRLMLPLPLFAFCAVAAFFARGASAAAILAMPFGAIAAQTHVLTIPTVGAVTVVALLAFVAGSFKRGITKRDLLYLVAAVGVAVVLFLPPIIEQLRGGDQGNISKIMHFDRSAPKKPWGAALECWVTATSWLPERVFSLRAGREDGMPLMMRWDSVPFDPEPRAFALAALHVFAVLGSLVVALRRRDLTSAALLAVGALGEVVGVSTVRSLSGQEHYSLLFWTIAPSTVAWFGVVATGVSVLLSRRPEAWPRVASAGVAVALYALVPQAQWIAHNPVAPSSDPRSVPERRAAYEAIRAYSERTATVPVIHLLGSWGDALMVILEYDKDGGDLRISDADAFAVPGGRLARDGAFTHFWLERPELPVPMAKCIERVSSWGPLTLYAHPIERWRCD